MLSRRRWTGAEREGYKPKPDVLNKLSLSILEGKSGWGTHLEHNLRDGLSEQCTMPPIRIRMHWIVTSSQDTWWCSNSNHVAANCTTCALVASKVQRVAEKWKNEQKRKSKNKCLTSLVWPVPQEDPRVMMWVFSDLFLLIAIFCRFYIVILVFMDDWWSAYAYCLVWAVLNL